MTSRGGAERGEGVFTPRAGRAAPPPGKASSGGAGRAAAAPCPPATAVPRPRASWAPRCPLRGEVTTLNPPTPLSPSRLLCAAPQGRALPRAAVAPVSAAGAGPELCDKGPGRPCALLRVFLQGRRLRVAGSHGKRTHVGVIPCLVGRKCVQLTSSVRPVPAL